MFRFIIYSFILFAFFPLQVLAQITITNSGFEGVPGSTNSVPAGFNACIGTPDIGPGMWGMNVPPSQGNSYMYLTAAGNGSGGWGAPESASAQLSSNLIAGMEYCFDIDVISMEGSASSGSQRWGSSLSIYGGNSSCATSELLWNSGLVRYNGPSDLATAYPSGLSDGIWQTFNVVFIPSANYDYLVFVNAPPTQVAGVTGETNYGCCYPWGNGSIGIDNMSSISPCSPLPVELVDYTTHCKEGQVQLKWSTASELNSDKFEIEYSSDGIQFENVGEITSVGNSQSINSYEWHDSYRHGSGYYRLKQVDLNGEFEYSSVKGIFCETASNEILVYPNPSENIINIHIENTKGSNVINLLDMNGRIIKEIQVLSKIQTYTIEATNIESGLYMIQVISDHRIMTKKLRISH